MLAAGIAVYFFKAHQKLKSKIKKTSQEAQELAEKLKEHSVLKNEEQKHSDGGSNYSISCSIYHNS